MATFAEALKTGNAGPSIKEACKAAKKVVKPAHYLFATAIIGEVFEKYAHQKGESIGTYGYPTTACRDGITAAARQIGLTVYDRDKPDVKSDLDALIEALCGADVLSSIIPRKGQGASHGVGRILGPGGHFGGGNGSGGKLVSSILARMGQK